MKKNITNEHTRWFIGQISYFNQVKSLMGNSLRIVLQMPTTPHIPNIFNYNSMKGKGIYGKA